MGDDHADRRGEEPAIADRAPASRSEGDQLGGEFEHRVAALTTQLGLPGVETLGALFDLTSQRLVRMAVAVTRNQYDAEDAIQSALERVARRPAALRHAERPWPYLLRVVRNEALAITRKRRRWFGLVGLGNAIGSANGAGSGGRVGSSGPIGIADLVTRRSVDELEREDTHRAVWAALRELPREQAEVVALRTWEDFTFAEIADVLGVSPNTVASRYQYGLTKLAAKLRKTADETLEQTGGRR